MKIKKSQSMNWMNRAIPLILVFAFLLFGYQNCSPNIQVTDQSAKVGLLDQATPQEVPALPEIPNSQEPIIPIPNPNLPFTPAPGVVLLPIQGEWASIAFEDNISSPEAGDRDYNDAVFNYRIAEQSNSLSQLSKIFLEVRLRERQSVNNHILSLILDGNRKKFYNNITYESAPAFNGSAKIKITDQDGEVTQLDSLYGGRIEVFSSTNNRIGDVIKIEITLLQPELNARTNVQSVDYKKYRFILSNHGNENTGIDIAEINSTDEMLSNGNNFPFGFMIPTDWQPPREKQFINSAYPKFELYRNWLIDRNHPTPTIDILNWYLN